MNFWQEKINIGNYKVPRFIGGPLDGITDSPFRKLVREFSKDELLYTEMRHVACVAHDKGGVRSLDFAQFERPLNYQIAANSTNFIEQACEKIVAAGVDMVDLNIGCPAKNVVNSGSGSALMADRERLKAIVTALRAELPIPLTIKMRAGFKCQNAVEIAQLMQDCGVDALAIHPRLQTQKFDGQPDYKLAAQVKKAVSIPVIISGGVVNWKTAQLVYEQTGVDGFLISRGIWARPWKLLELREHSYGNPYMLDMPTTLYYGLKHFEALLEYYGDHGLYVFRKHLPFYMKGFFEAAEIRQKLATTTIIDEVRSNFALLMEKLRK